MSSYILATNKSWCVDAFMSWRAHMIGNWKVCVCESDLLATSNTVDPRFVFFPHWSDIVPTDFLDSYECVCFHMTDVPFGRGGSPLQNLISRGHKETVLTALRMTPDLDAGPVYLKRPLRLDGSAHEIFLRAAEIMMQMIQEIVLTEPQPIPQVGDPVLFKRRTPSQSRLPDNGELGALFDHIRMLDAPTYPLAFIEHGDFVLEFSNAKFEGDEVRASVVVRKQETMRTQ